MALSIFESGAYNGNKASMFLQQEERSSIRVILGIFIILPLLLGCIIALHTAVCVAAVSAGGALLENRFNVTVDKETYQPNAAEFGAVFSSIAVGSVALSAFGISHFMAANGDSGFAGMGLCLCSIYSVTILGGIGLMLTSPYFVSVYITATSPSDAYVALGIHFGLQILSRCLLRTGERGEEQNMSEVEENRIWGTFKLLAKWGMHVASAAVIYKALTNSGRISNVDGMLQVSCVFGAFFQPIMVAFLPFFYPEAFVGA